MRRDMRTLERASALLHSSYYGKVRFASLVEEFTLCGLLVNQEQFKQQDDAAQVTCVLCIGAMS